MIASDLSKLSDEEKEKGVGQLQSGPTPPSSSNQPSNRSAEDREKENQRIYDRDRRFRDDINSNGRRNNSYLYIPALGAFGGAIVGSIDRETGNPPQLPTDPTESTITSDIASDSAAYSSTESPPSELFEIPSMWDSSHIPLWEITFQTTWTFESRTNQSLIVGNDLAVAKRFDWTGTPGFSTRLAIQSERELGLEMLFDYSSYDESYLYADATDFATYPNISFTSHTVGIERRATVASGQLNLIYRERPYSHSFAGLRWWHQDDLLLMQVLPDGAIWYNETQSNAPFVHMGLNYATKFFGVRSLWTNRFSGGVGGNWVTGRTNVENVVGVPNIDSIDAVRLAAFFELRSELAYALTDRFSLRAGTQFLGLSNTYRAANQIRTTDLSAGTSSLHSTPLLLSSFNAGLHYKY